MNVIKLDRDGSPALRFERVLPHSVERVWRAISDPAELEGWFLAAPAWTPTTGEKFEAMGMTGTVTVADPPRALAWEFAGESYRFELEAVAEGCRLVFEHVFDPSAGSAAGHAPGWEAVFARLEPWIEGAPVSWAQAHEMLSEHGERYAAAFGESAANGRRAHAEHAELRFELDATSLRFERGFGYPIERVWRALSEERAAWFPTGVEFVVTREEPPHLLEGMFSGDRISFELTAQADGCRLRFRHDVSDPEGSALAAAGWDRCLVRLDALLAGTRLDEAGSLELWPAVHERYAEKFGVDPALGRRMFSKHVAG